MATISKPHVHVDGEYPTASIWNNNEDPLYNEINGQIDNANVKAAAGIVPSKIDLAWSCYIPAKALTTASSGGAVAGTYTYTDTTGNPAGAVLYTTLDTLDFGETTEKDAFGTFCVPVNFANTGASSTIRVRLSWAQETASTNKVCWAVAVKAFAVGAETTFLATNWTTDTTGTAGPNSVSKVTHTTIDYALTLAAATWYIIAMCRRPTVTADNYAADAKLLGVNIECVE